MLTNIGALRVNFERSSPGKDAIVFVHSLGADLSIFDAQAKALAADYDVIRYDIRGHGRSSLEHGNPSLAILAGDLGHLLDYLDVPAAHLVGQSIGGMIVLALATQRPLRRHTLCLFDTIGWTTEEWDRKYTVRAAEIDVNGMPAVADAVAHAALGKTTHKTRTSVRKAYTDRIARANAAGYSWCCKSMIGFDLRAGLDRITCPVQLVAGDEDTVTPLPHLRELAKRLKDARVREVHGAGHVPFVEDPELATRYVREWVASHPLPKTGSGTPPSLQWLGSTK
jgi:3-oxoadipate enol-lactonase